MKFRRRDQPPVAPFDDTRSRRLEYMRTNAEPIRELARKAASAGRRGDPDPVTGTGCPEVFTRCNALFIQFAASLKKQALDECDEDVAFLVRHAIEYTALASKPSTSHLPGPNLDREFAARLLADFGQRLGRLAAHVDRHRAELDELVGAADATTTMLKEIWQSKHPHPNHLAHFPIPDFVLPDGIDDIGQAHVRGALDLGTRLVANTAPAAPPRSGIGFTATFDDADSPDHTDEGAA